MITAVPLFPVFSFNKGTLKSKGQTGIAGEPRLPLLLDFRVYSKLVALLHVRIMIATIPTTFLRIPVRRFASFVNVGALIIRIRFEGILYYTYNMEPPKPYSNY